MKATIEKEFKERPEHVFQSLLRVVPSSATKKKEDTEIPRTRRLTEEDLRNNLYFGDFMRSKDETRFYEEINNFDLLKEVQFPL